MVRGITETNEGVREAESMARECEHGKGVREVERPERVEAWSAWSLGGCHEEREREREKRQNCF